MIVKKNYDKGKLILAACDEEIFNKKIENEKHVLDLTSSFYKGISVSDDEFLKLIKEAYIVNAVGKKVIKALIKNKIITKEETRKIKDIPYTMILFKD